MNHWLHHDKKHDKHHGDDDKQIDEKLHDEKHHEEKHHHHWLHHAKDDKDEDHLKTPLSPAEKKYLKDPMRNTNSPDHLGEYKDPISQHAGKSYLASTDPTNTGA